MQICKNIKQARLIAGKSQREVADHLGTKRSTYANWESTIEPDVDTLKRIANYLDTSLDKLLLESAEAKSYVEQRRDLKTQANPYLVPFVDIPAQAGYTKAYSNIDYIQTLKHFPILPDVDPTGGTWRYFQIEGDSMEPEIRGGDTILASLVLREDWLDLKDYYTYVVVTDEELLIKDILKESERSWILLSQNSHHKPRRLDVEKVRQVWVARRHVKNRMGKSRMYNLSEIKKDLK